MARGVSAAEVTGRINRLLGRCIAENTLHGWLREEGGGQIVFFFNQSPICA